jgi:hypothetical protein
MLEMATETVPVIRTRSSPAVPAPGTPAANVRLTPRASASSTPTAKLEALLGFAGLLVVALLAPLVLVRQREVARLRDAVAHALALESRQRPLLAAAGVPAPGIPAAEPASVPAGTPAPASPGAAAAPAFAERPPSVYRARPGRRALVVAGTLAVALAAVIAVGVLYAMR